MGRPRTACSAAIGSATAALEMIDRDGLGDLSMRKLAAALGVQAASLYKHYPTKDDVLDDVASQVVSGAETPRLSMRVTTGTARRLRAGSSPRRRWPPPPQPGALPGRRARPAATPACGSPMPCTAVWCARAGYPAERDADRRGDPVAGVGLHGRVVLRAGSPTTSRSTVTATRT